MKSDKLLREMVRKTLTEEFGDYGGGSNYGGATPWTGGYGGSGKNSKSGMGGYGMDLSSIFIQPFVDAIKVIGAEIGQAGVRIVTLIRTALETALGILVPKFQVDYKKIQATQTKYITKITTKYKDAYEAIDQVYENPDYQLFSFMHNPATWLSYKMITAKPEAALTVYDAIAEGNQAMLLYLRDIRNRMYGTQQVGGGLPSGGGSTGVPVASHTEAVAPKAKKKTPGELLADALTSPEFAKLVDASPIAQQMKQDAAKIDNNTNNALKQAMAPILNADTAEDLAHASSGGWQVPQDYAKMSPEEKVDADEQLVGQTKASMKAFYAAQLEEQLKQATTMGISDQSPYVQSLKNMIQSLK